MLVSLVRYRRFIWQHALADVRHRYAGTGMGLVWNVLHPLGLIAIYSLVFSTVMAVSNERAPGRFGYTIYLCAGFFPWLAFSECLTRGASAFSANATFLKKLPVPEQVFVAQSAAAATLGLCISFGLLMAVALVLGVQPQWTWLLLPIPLILLQLTGLGLGLGLGTLNVFFADVGQMLTLLLQILFWLTPVVYFRDILPNWLNRIVAFHPVTPAIESVRQLFLYGHLPTLGQWLFMIAWAMVAMTLGMATLGALRSEIRDNL